MMHYNNILKLCFILLFSLIVFNASFVSAQEQTGKILGNVRVEGDYSSQERMIILYSGLLPPGIEVYAENFSDAVKKLWELDQFSDIRIFVDNPEDRIINVLIEVEEYPLLSQVRLDGNEKIDDNKILGLVNFYSGQKINRKHILTGKQRIKNLYDEKGYLLAQISDSLITHEDKRVDIVYTIDEGEKVKIENINFIGNETFDEKTLRKQLKKTKQDGLFRGGDFDRLEYEEDKKNLIEFYKKEGYTYAAILSDSIYYDDEKKHMNILIQIDEGILYYFRSITFEGNEKFSFEYLEERVDIKSGDKFNSEKLQMSVDNITQLYYNSGHLNTLCNPSGMPVGVDSIDIKYNIYEGSPFRINRINITGNTKTKDKVIRREIVMKPGDIFNHNLIQRSFQRISLLNYFSNLQFDSPKLLEMDGNSEQGEDQKVDIGFFVEEKSTDTANMSAGYSQRDGLIGSLGLSMNNFMGNGQQLFIDWTFGRIFRSFQIGFTEPWLFDTPTLAGFSIFDIRRGGRIYAMEYESKGATFRVGRRLRWPDDYFRGDWFFEVSKNRYFNFRDDIDFERYMIGRENTTKVSITQIISRDSRSNRKDPAIAAEFPSDGSTVTFSTQFSGGILGGTENFIKYMFSSEWYTPAMFDFVLYNNILLGYIDNFNVQSNISLQELFYMGGSALAIGTPLRGYEERSIGPLSSMGNPLGGKAVLKVTTELRFNISPKPTIYGLVFAEAGNNWNDMSFIDPFSLKRSVGIGARLFMPMIGMIGLDLGYGFDPIYGQSKGWMPHFVFGRGF